MLERLTKALQARNDVKAWSVQQSFSRGTQQYEMPGMTEARRHVDNETYTVTVLRETPDADGNPGCGEGRLTILPGADIEHVLDEAALMAGMVHNPPYDFVEKASLPAVDLADPVILEDPDKGMQQALKELQDTTEAFPSVRLTAAECFAEETGTTFINSKGMTGDQKGTRVHLEWVFIAGEGDGEVETFVELDRRRFEDLKLNEEVSRRAQYATDLLSAGPAPDYEGPVIIRGGTLADVMNAQVIQILSSATFKFSGETPWDIGKPIVPGDVTGDPVTIYANRLLPFGTGSNRFDADGVPAQRVKLIGNQVLQAWTARKQFADYLGIPATGTPGNIELAAGTTTESELLAGDHIEAAEFSWFNANPISGDFACEMRLGYEVKDGKRRAFKGGLLVGNVLAMLADVTLSQETGFYRKYAGPVTARFNQLKVAGG